MHKYTKEELENRLKREKWMFSSAVYEYFEYLLNLDFSVMRDYITNEEREVISAMGIYNALATYNIYERSLDILMNNVKDLNICDRQLLIASTVSDNRNIPLFMYAYNLSNKQIGNVNLFQTFSDNPAYKDECNLTHDTCALLLEDYGVDDSSLNEYNSLEIVSLKSMPNLLLLKRDRYSK